MRPLAVLFMLTLSSCSYAATEWYWDAPTERLDGSTFLPTEIDQFEINLDCGVEKFDFITQATSFTVPQDVKGECLAKVLVIDTDGLKSDYSEVITINLRAVPRNPFNLRSTRN